MGWDGKEEEFACMWKHQRCLELCLGVNDELAGTLWVKSSVQADISNAAVSVSYPHYSAGQFGEPL